MGAKSYTESPVVMTYPAPRRRKSPSIILESLCEIIFCGLRLAKAAVSSAVVGFSHVLADYGACAPDWSSRWIYLAKRRRTH